MKRHLILAATLLILFFLSTIGSAQYMLNKGQTQLNAGLGFSSWGLPFYFGLDHGIHKDISVGGEFSFRSYNERWHDYTYNHSIWGISANANYHFNSICKIPKNWDLYAGLNLGFYAWSYPDNYPGNHVSGLGLGGQAGGRYYFNERFGINLEFGGGNAFSGGKFGVTCKL
jgi:hypothetical protein